MFQFQSTFSDICPFQLLPVSLSVKIGLVIIEDNVKIWSRVNTSASTALRTNKHGQTLTTAMYFTFIKGLNSGCKEDRVWVSRI